MSLLLNTIILYVCAVCVQKNGITWPQKWRFPNFAKVPSHCSMTNYCENIEKEVNSYYYAFARARSSHLSTCFVPLEFLSTGLMYRAGALKHVHIQNKLLNGFILNISFHLVFLIFNTSHHINLKRLDILMIDLYFQKINSTPSTI